VPDLASLERRFRALVVGEAPLATAGELILGDHVDAADRMRVYVHAYVERIRAALADDFPKLAVVLGDDDFAALVRLYLQAHPPRHWSLSGAGDRLAGFVAGDARWPAWLADLARLERARVEAFDAADAAPLSRDDLARVSPEAFAGLHLALVPSARVITLASPADDAWSAIEDRVPWTPPAPTTTHVAVWRRELTVIHRRLAADEAAFLARLAGGAALAAACGALADHPDPAQRSLSIMLAAIDSGLLFQNGMRSARIGVAGERSFR
jgi:hypothetical protein